MTEMTDEQLDEMLADVTEQSNQLDSIAALVSQLRTAVNEELVKASASAGAKAKVDAIFAKLEGNSQKIASALGSTTPANQAAALSDAGHAPGSGATTGDGSPTGVPMTSPTDNGQLTSSGMTTDQQPQRNGAPRASDPVQSQIDQGTPLAPGSTGRQPVDPNDVVDPDSGAGQNTGVK